METIPLTLAMTDCRPALLRYAGRLVGRQRAEDVVQNALTAAWAHVADPEPIRDVTSWLMRITHNCASNELRRAAVHPTVMLCDDAARTAGSLEHDAEVRDDFSAMASSVVHLPASQRHVLLATAVHGRSLRDVGLQTGMSECAARQLLFRARGTVRSDARAVAA
jgi:RNA polymerase sigma-70 factor, ECF subfamily